MILQYYSTLHAVHYNPHLGPYKGTYPCPPFEFQSLVCRYFGRFPCCCQNFDKTSIACRHFVALVSLSQGRVAVSRPCRCLKAVSLSQGRVAVSRPCRCLKAVSLSQGRVAVSRPCRCLKAVSLSQGRVAVSRPCRCLKAVSLVGIYPLQSPTPALHSRHTKARYSPLECLATVTYVLYCT